MPVIGFIYGGAVSHPCGGRPWPGRCRSRVARPPLQFPRLPEHAPHRPSGEITVEQAAAPYSSLAFMFWGAGLFVFPLMLLYTAISLTVFRGKVVRPAD